MTPEGYKKHKELIEAWANGAVIQTKSIIGNWVDIVHYPPDWDIKREYRIKPAEPDSINWDHVHTDYNYMARDMSGNVGLYTKKPKISKQVPDIWISGTPGSRFTDVSGFSSYKQGEVDWKDSLVCRPGFEEK